MATQIGKFLELLLRSGLAAPSDIVVWSAGFLVARTDENAVADLCRHFVDRGVLTQWQCDKLRMGKWKGFFLDGYCFMSWIGKDTTSATFLCEEVATGRHVTMRVTSPAIAPRDGRIHYELLDPSGEAAVEEL